MSYSVRKHVILSEKKNILYSVMNMLYSVGRHESDYRAVAYAYFLFDCIDFFVLDSISILYFIKKNVVR